MTRMAGLPGASQARRIGFLSSALAGDYANALILGAVDAARERSANLICFEVGHVHSPFVNDRRQVLCEIVGPEALDGIIVWSQGIDTFVSGEELRDFLRATCLDRLPIVSIGSAPGIPSVSWDMGAGVHEAVSHLIEMHGRRRIAWLRGPEHQVAAQEMYRGYERALVDHGLPVDPDLVTPPRDWGQATGIAGVHDLFDHRQAQPDAIASADAEAIAVMDQLSHRGIRTPDDVSVVGFNDQLNAPLRDPSAYHGASADRRRSPPRCGAIARSPGWSTDSAPGPTARPPRDAALLRLCAPIHRGGGGRAGAGYNTRACDRRVASTHPA